jgi:hypothetical protein
VTELEFYLVIGDRNIENSWKTEREVIISYERPEAERLSALSNKRIMIFKGNQIMYESCGEEWLPFSIENNAWYAWEIVDLIEDGECICFSQTGKTDDRYCIPHDITEKIVDFIAEQELLVK